jgi:hypothetical protein
MSKCREMPDILVDEERPSKKSASNLQIVSGSVQDEHGRSHEADRCAAAQQDASNTMTNQADICQKTSAQPVATVSLAPNECAGVSGGLFTSRLPCPVKLLHCFFTVRPNRIRIQDDRPTIYPEFAGAPTWSKPLLYAEYQVCTQADLRVLKVPVMHTEKGLHQTKAQYYPNGPV